MPPQLALFSCFGLIAWLFRMDFRWRKVSSKAVLIPGIWIAILGSRPVSYWFGGRGGSDANPIDTLVYLGLIASAIYVLSSRKLKWGELVQKNRTLFLVYGYLLLSVIWSAMPATSGKRIFKDFGCVLVGLVFLTELNPAMVVRAVFVRVSYILFPLSAVFIKFIPEIGRSSSRAGEAMFGGVTTQKNSLGETVFVFSIMILWDLIEIYKEKNRKGKKFQMGVRVGMLLLGVWLLKTCDSQTSMLCLVIGGTILWGTQRLLQMRKGRRVLILILTCIVCLVVMDKTFGLSGIVIRALGRDPNLTGRTDIWKLVLDQETDPVLGEGFYIFWDSPKGKAVIESFMQVNSAHNGYLDLYMDGGALGVLLLVVTLLLAGRRAIDRLFSGDPLGKVGLAFWFLPILYNFSESSFFRLDVLWFTFLLLCVVCPLTRWQKLYEQKLDAAGLAPSGYA